MVAAMTDDTELYPFDRVLERVIGLLACSNRKFWGSVGKHIDPDGLRDPLVKLALTAARALMADSTPPSLLTVRQRLQTWHADGKYTIEEMDEIMDVLDGWVEDEGLYDEEVDGIIKEVGGILRRRAQQATVLQALDTFSKHGDLDRVVAQFDRVKRIGAVDTASGTLLGPSIIHDIRNQSSVERIETGIQELDEEIKGGAKRGTFCVVSAATNVGKSMFLGHVAAHVLTQGMNVAIATLELSETDQHNRIISNLVDIPSDDIEASAREAEKAKERLEGLTELNLLGFCTCKYFEARTTKPADILNWAEAESLFHKRKFDVLILDYVSLVGSTNEKSPFWRGLQETCEEFKHWGEVNDILVWTANQANAEGMNTKKTKRLDNHHSADSKGVPKTADLHITLNPDEEDMLTMFVAKNRHGPKHAEVGPLPTDFERGRCGPISRLGWPY